MLMIESKKMSGTPLELTLVAKAQKTAIDEALLVEVILHNKGSEPTTINGRLLFNSVHAPDYAKEITIEIVGPPDYFSLIKFHVNAGPPQPEHFVELKPNEIIRKTFELTKYFSMHVPGEYRLVATYTNTSDLRVYGRKTWTGKLTSNTVTVKRVK